MWLKSLDQCRLECVGANSASKNLAESSPIWFDTCSGDSIMVAPYLHPQHMKVVNHSLHV